MTRYHLAQLNVGIIKAPLESPVMADFVNNLDRINALAEARPDSSGACKRRKATRPRCGPRTTRTSS